MKYLITLSLVLSSNSYAAVASFQQDQGKIEILAKGRPSALKIKGSGSGPTGSMDISNQDVKGELEFNLESLDTGIKLRNEHMKKKYLQTDTYPKAKLTISMVDLQSKDSNQNFDLTDTKFEGTLNLHGVDKPVNGTVTINKKDSDINVKAIFKINIKDFSIETPSFAGITVTDEVLVSVDTKATVQK